MEYKNTKKNDNSTRQPIMMSSLTLPSTYLIFILCYLPFACPISVPEIQGWHLHSLRVVQNHRLHMVPDRQQDQSGVDLGVTLGAPNLQQCLRLCWLYTVCGSVSYSITSPLSSISSTLSSSTSSSSTSSSSPSCQLFVKDSDRFVTSSPDPRSIVVDMTRAVIKKDRLHGCDTRPCGQHELCISVRSQDNYRCLPMVSMICGAPTTQIDNAVSTTDGIGYAYYRCKEGYAARPDRVVKSECDRTTKQWSAVTLSCRWVDCGPPSTLEGADVRYTSTQLDSVSIYTCRSGRFSPSEKNMTVRCLRSGSWSVLPRSCTLVDCGQPEASDYGHVDLPDLVVGDSVTEDTRTFYGGVVTHTCLRGYESPLSSAISRCQNTGRWSDPPAPFQCQPVECGRPPTFGFATQVFTSTTYLSNVTYSCVEGYRIASSDSSSRDNHVIATSSQCQHDGSWTAVNVTCIPVDCGQGFQDLPGMDVITNTTTYGSIATLQCSDDSHLFKGNNQLTCNASGLWSEVNASCSALPCDTPPSVVNATLTVQMGGDGRGDHDNEYTAIYQSLPGYIFNSGEVFERYTCVDGSWVGSPGLHTIPVDCRDPPPVPNADVSATDHTYTSKATYTCRTGFQNTTMFNQVTCLADGSWSSEEIGCEKIICGFPPLIEHSRIVDIPAELAYGDRVVYECVDGYFMKTSQDWMVCGGNGWNNTGVECVRNDCGTPPLVSYSTFIIQGTDAIYTCEEGFVFANGSSSRITCRSGGWSEEEVIMCDWDGCLIPPEVENAASVFNSTGRNSTVTYVCQDGLRLKNASSNSRRCQDNHDWSSEEIACTPDDCGPPPTVHNSTFVMDAESVVYSCDEGFVLVDGNVSRRTCRGGRWSEKEVMCVLDGCLIPPEVENAISVSNSSVVTYTCKTGYRLTADDVNQRLCQENRKWSSENVTCHLIECGTPPSLANTETTSIGRNVGTTVDYTCKAGYKVQESSGTAPFEGVVNDSPPVFMPGANIENDLVNGDDASQLLIVNDEQVIDVPETDVIWTAECNGSGEWTSNTARPAGCDPLDCGDPPSVANTALTQSPANTTFGSSVQYSCLSGFSLVSADNNSKTCGVSGMWEGDVECASIRCPDYESVPNANVTKEGRKPGDVVIYECDWGRHHWWFDRKMCLDNGTWSAPRIECRIVDCGTPPDVEFATVSYTTTTVESYAQYNCIEGYVRTHGTRSKLCLDQGTWGSLYLQCKPRGESSCNVIGKDNSYEHIRYTNMTENALATYSCVEGSYLRIKFTNVVTPVGYNEHSLVCRSGEWTGERHTCEPIDCGSTPSVANGKVTDTSGSTYQSQVSYHCPPGYVMPGPTSKTCLADGRWSDEAVECIREDLVHCSPPPTTNHVTIEYKSHTVGSTAVYTCIEGFINNTKHVECLPSGLWSDLGDFKCVPVNCQSPPEMAHTTIHVRETSYGHHAIYTCSVYGQDDDRRPSRSQCLANGQWSSVDSPCFHCGTPPQPSHTVNLTQTTNHLYDIGETVSYTCSDGYSTIPSSMDVQMTCGQGGEWSHGDSEALCINTICLNGESLDPRIFLVEGSIDLNKSHVVGRYRCVQGWNIQGKSIDDVGDIFCDFTTGWLTQDFLPCVPVECGTPPVIAFASILGNETTYQYKVTYTCDATYLRLGNTATSVCRVDGTWSPVDVMCVQCSPDYIIENGRLIEANVTSENNQSTTTADGTNQDQQPQQPTYQQGYVQCQHDHLLYSNAGLADPTLTCVLGANGGPEWKQLGNLECVQNVWEFPREAEIIRLDQSYPYYQVCAELTLPDSTLGLNLIAFPGTTATQSVLAVGILITKSSNKLDLLQAVDAAASISPFVWQFKDLDIHTVCIDVYPDTKMYKVWMDGDFVGMMNMPEAPDVTDIKEFQFAGQGHFEVYRLEIRI